jgi:hypothetical protein
VEFVGETRVVASVLTRVTTPAGAVSGAAVDFKLTGMEGAAVGVEVTVPAATTSEGHAQATFTLTVRGKYTVEVVFAGDTCLRAASSSADFRAYQRVHLTLTADAGTICGATSTLRAKLTTVPGATAVDGQAITFQQNGVTATTSTGADGTAGEAVYSFSYPTAGPASFRASFSNVADHFANEAGLLDVSEAETTGIIEGAATALSNVAAPVSAVLGATVRVSTVLTRTDSPAGEVVGVDVELRVFTPTGETEIYTGTAACACVRVCVCAESLRCSALTCLLCSPLLVCFCACRLFSPALSSPDSGRRFG